MILSNNICQFLNLVTHHSLRFTDHPVATVIPTTTSVGSMPGLNVGDTITLTCRVQYAAPTMDAGFTSSIGYPQEPQIQMFLGEQNLTNRSRGGQISYQNSMGSPIHYKILVRIVMSLMC